MCVLLVAPTSTSFAPDVSRISGILNPPPISTSSPRETMTSFFLPLARWRRMMTSAAAQLLTTVADGASRRHARAVSRYSARFPLVPSGRLNSRFEYPVAIFCRADAAVCPSGDLPRFVWMRTPVPLMTGCSLDAEKWLIFSVMEVSISARFGSSPLMIC